MRHPAEADLPFNPTLQIFFDRPALEWARVDPAWNDHPLKGSTEGGGANAQALVTARNNLIMEHWTAHEVDSQLTEFVQESGTKYLFNNGGEIFEEIINTSCALPPAIQGHHPHHPSVRSNDPELF